MFKLIQKFDGKYVDMLTTKWSEYETAAACLKWQAEVEHQKLLNETVELTCVTAEKAEALLGGAALKPGDTVELVMTATPQIAWYGYAIAAVMSVVISVIVWKVACFIGRDWSK